MPFLVFLYPVKATVLAGDVGWRGAVRALDAVYVEGVAEEELGSAETVADLQLGVLFVDHGVRVVTVVTELYQPVRRPAHR